MQKIKKKAPVGKEKFFQDQSDLPAPHKIKWSLPNILYI